jgi:hypothetical protein
MKTLKIYDPAMCCSSGVCGPSVDPKLAKLAADVAFLKSRGVQVERFNLGHQPEAFTANPQVLSEMGQEAQHLPIFLVEGNCKAKGRYPNRQELAEWFDLEVSARTELRMTTQCCDDPSSEGCC